MKMRKSEVFSLEMIIDFNIYFIKKIQITGIQLLKYYKKGLL